MFLEVSSLIFSCFFTKLLTLKITSVGFTGPGFLANNPKKHIWAMKTKQTLSLGIQSPSEKSLGKVEDELTPTRFPLKTKSCHLKNDAWKIIFFLKWVPFQANMFILRWVYPNWRLVALPALFCSSFCWS